MDLTNARGQSVERQQVAMGGFEVVARRRVQPNHNKCRHRDVITIRAAGTVRVVCEKCGHISFRFESDLSEEIERDRFARAIDNPSGT